MRKHLSKALVLGTVVACLVGCESTSSSKEETPKSGAPSLWSKLNINELDFLIDFLNPNIETAQEKQEAATRPYTVKEEADALNQLVGNRKLNISLHAYMKQLDTHIKHLSPSSRRDVMNSLMEVIAMNERLSNAKYNAYKYDIYKLVNKYKKPQKVLHITSLKGKSYLTDLFKESRKNHMLLLKKNYIDEYKVEVDYTYIKKKYGRYMDSDLRKKLDSKLYKSLQYNTPL